MESLAWVVMPDHFHWLIELQDASLATVMQRTKSRSALAIGCALGLRYDEDLAGVARYVVANPLRAGLVKHLGDYPHWDAIWL